MTVKDNSVADESDGVNVTLTTAPEALAHGETATLTVTITNESANEDESEYQLLFVVQSGLEVQPTEIGVITKRNSTRKGEEETVVTIQFSKLAVKEPKNFSIKVKMQSGVLHFDRKSWQAELQPVEEAKSTTTKKTTDTTTSTTSNKQKRSEPQPVRCAAQWSESPDSIPYRDAILFAGNNMALSQLLAWQQLAQAFHLNLRIWDYHYYQGISYNITTRHKYTKWKKRGSSSSSPLLIFCLDPNADSPELRRAYWGINFSDLISHFQLKNEIHETFPEIDLRDRFDDGCLFFGLSRKRVVECLGYEGNPVDLSDQQMAYGGSNGREGTWLDGPALEPLQRKAKTILEKFHMLDPEHLYTITYVNLESLRPPAKKGSGTTTTSKNNSRNLEISRIPIPSSAKLSCLPFNTHVTPAYVQKFDTGSPIVSCSLNLLLSLSVKHRFLLLISMDDIPASSWAINDEEPSSTPTSPRSRTELSLPLFALTRTDANEEEEIELSLTPRGHEKKPVPPATTSLDVGTENETGDKAKKTIHKIATSSTTTTTTPAAAPPARLTSSMPTPPTKLTSSSSTPAMNGAIELIALSLFLDVNADLQRKRAEKSVTLDTVASIFLSNLAAYNTPKLLFPLLYLVQRIEQHIRAVKPKSVSSACARIKLAIRVQSGDSAASVDS